ncbi:hypothetical protein GPECTOR_14g263 [Gonium pectorale]|uniref:Fucolectin tachylectin-4 pentraxin-1 domain-containing protein n=1 Tax=Gonium pectorale TaxID=33097 RepID=A0A150GMF6_GONPE|nr:hypothetical protein GPECTOR_14g263 [Gonium pectorale]|eukprot:KXZ51023.1 hypothetical protein GPECTOR_14g263 [Gonium pectorale]
MVTLSSSYGDAGFEVGVDCGSGSKAVTGTFARSASWDPADTPTPGTWPDGLDGTSSPTGYTADCAPTQEANGVIMYEDQSSGSAVVFSYGRGTGRYYYVGLDFDVTPRVARWGQLLEAIALQAASNSAGMRVSPSIPPSPPAPPAPESSGLSDDSDLSIPSVRWPVGRGRVSYTAAGYTATAGLTSPPEADIARSTYLCHDLPTASSQLLGGADPWVAFDLGTARRVVEVRVQQLVARDSDGQGVFARGVELQVRVQATAVDTASGPAIDEGNQLCSDLTTTIDANTDASLGSAPAVTSCGNEKGLIGRYVSVLVIGGVPGANYMALCGVDIVGLLPDTYGLVSRNKPVCVSSSGSSAAVSGTWGLAVGRVPADMDPSLAVDGLYNDNRKSNGMCALSHLQQDPFITIDLGASMLIERVEVTKSSSYHHSAELNDFSIVASDVDCVLAGNPMVTLAADQVSTCATNLVLAAGSTGVYNCSGTKGRYLTISMQGYYGYLRLCELDVFAALPSSQAYSISTHRRVVSDPAMETLLFGQDTATTRDVAGLLVDAVTPSGLRSTATGGSSDTDIRSACVSGLTYEAGSPWVAIDLGASFFVQHVQLHFVSHLDEISSYGSGYKATLDVRLGDTAMIGGSEATDNPACVSAAGIFAGLEDSFDVYGSGENVRRYRCGYQGRYVTVAALRTAADDFYTIGLPPLCEVEVYVVLGSVAPVGYLSSLALYAAGSDGSGGSSASNATLALQNPNYRSGLVTEEQVLTSGIAAGTTVTFTLSNDTASPPTPGYGDTLRGGSNVSLPDSAVTVLQADPSDPPVGRYLMITHADVDTLLVLCQVWVYTSDDTGITAGVGGRGPRPGVLLRKTTGRVTEQYGSLPVQGGGQQDALPARRRSLLQSFGPASLFVDLGLARSVEVALLRVVNSSIEYDELGDVQVLLSNSTSGADPHYCAFDVTIELTIARHVFGCNGGYGRYVVASRTVSYAMPSDAGLEVYLNDDSSQTVVSSLRPTSQSGGVSSEAGGSDNAVNGFYSSAAVDAAVSAGRLGVYFGAATDMAAGPWWAVDLGAALPITFVEVTPHPSPADGLDLEAFEVLLSNHTLVYGTEGATVLQNLTVVAGAAGRFSLGGVAARQVVIRQPSYITRSLELAQVDVYVDHSTVAANSDTLITDKPLSYPVRVTDAYGSYGTYTDEGGLSVSGWLAPLAADGYADTDTLRCARVGPGSGNPWLLVDLGSAVQVDRVELLKASDPGIASELDGVDVLLGNSTDAESNPVVLSGLSLPHPGSWATFYLSTPRPAWGRYLVIRMPFAEATLTVCEVNAYGLPSARVLVASDPAVYSVSGLSQALEALDVVVDYVTDLAASAGRMWRTYYDVIIFPKHLTYADYGEYYTALLDFLYDGGAVILGPSANYINITKTFTQNLVSRTSSGGFAGFDVTMDCGSFPVQITGGFNHSRLWNKTLTPTPGSWPLVLEPPSSPNVTTGYAANCPLRSANGTAMYADVGMAATTVFSYGRGAGRYYYVGVDFDVGARLPGWGQLLEAIALQAVSTLPSSRAPPAPPPPAGGPPAPVTPGLDDGTDLSIPSVRWPVGRGRVSYTAAGYTATAGLTSPPKATDPRVTYLCHDLPVADATASGTSLWMAVDLGTLRRVTEVRIQALEAWDAKGARLRKTVVKPQVYVTASKIGSSGPSTSAARLCPNLTLNLAANAEAGVGLAAAVASCGVSSSLVGRYVGIVLLGQLAGAASARLCGVDVVGTLPDTYGLVSRNKPVCISNSGKNANAPADVDPSLAVDGLYNDNRNAKGMCALSELRQDPFITIDLGASMSIARVEVTKSSSSAHSGELSGFAILATNVSCSEADNPLVTMYETSSICGTDLSLGSGQTGVYNCSGVTGRYLTIAMQGYYGYLRLCELDVYAALPGTQPSVVSVHKTVTASSDPDTLLPGQQNATTKSVAGVLVDAVTPTGLRSTATGGSSSANLNSTCATTATTGGDGGSPWFTLDLGSRFFVHYVRVHFISQPDEYSSYGATYEAALDIRLGDTVMMPGSDPSVNPACASAAGFFTGLEASFDLYGSGQNVRRYTCGYSGRYVTVSALRTSGHGNGSVALPPLCELEVLVDTGLTTPSYLSSLALYAAGSDGSGGSSASNATLALQNPNYRSGLVTEEQVCSMTLPEPGGRAFWMLDLGQPLQITIVEMRPMSSGGAFTVSLTLLNDTESLPLLPGSGEAFPSGTSIALGTTAAAFATLASVEAEAISSGIDGSGSGGVTIVAAAAAQPTVGRYLMITRDDADAALGLCQVWVYTATDTGVTGGSGRRGARPGVTLRRAGGRGSTAVGELPLEDKPAWRPRVEIAESVVEVAGDLAAPGIVDASAADHQLALASASSGSRAGRALQSTGPASLVVDLGLVRSVEVAVLGVPASSTYAEMSGVAVSVSNSSSGSPGTYCAFGVTIALTISRHVFGCNGAYGRYVVAARSVSYALPVGSSLEAYLNDPGTQFLASSLRPTSQSGGVSSGAGGSDNAVNGFYSSAAVDAAVSAGRLGVYFGAATDMAAGPWWAVDLGAALPIAFVEVTPHPSASDGSGLERFDLLLSNYTVVTGTEGTAALQELSLAPGGAGRYSLGGASARQLVVRQPSSITRSLQLAQVDVYVTQTAFDQGTNSLITDKPLSYPDVYDAYESYGAYTDESGADRTGELAPLAVDGYTDTDTSRCARVDRVELLKASDPAIASELDGVDVLLGNSTDAESNPVVLSGLSLPHPGSWATFYLSTPRPAWGRYLVIRMPFAEATLTVCEVNAYVATTLTASIAASTAAAAAASAAAAAGGAVAASSIPTGAAAGTAGTGAALAFVGHMQFFALTSSAAVPGRAVGNFNDTNSQLSWLNLEFGTLRALGVDLPRAEMVGYSQLINITIAWLLVLALHLALTAALRALRRRWARLAAMPLPAFLVFPFPEVFIVLFFLVSLASAAGRLLAAGVANGHGHAVAVGCVLVVLLAAMAAAVLRLLLRIGRAAARLGVRFRPAPRPPPVEKEGRVTRWLRLAERGHWGRPEGIELAQLEPHRTEAYMQKGFSLQAAVKATEPHLAGTQAETGVDTAGGSRSMPGSAFAAGAVPNADSDTNRGSDGDDRSTGRRAQQPLGAEAEEKGGGKELRELTRDESTKPGTAASMTADGSAAASVSIVPMPPAQGTGTPAAGGGRSIAFNRRFWLFNRGSGAAGGGAGGSNAFALGAAAAGAAAVRPTPLPMHSPSRAWGSFSPAAGTDPAGPHGAGAAAAGQLAAMDSDSRRKSAVLEPLSDLQRASMNPLAFADSVTAGHGRGHARQYASSSGVRPEEAAADQDMGLEDADPGGEGATDAACDARPAPVAPLPHHVPTGTAVRDGDMLVLRPAAASLPADRPSSKSLAAGSSRLAVSAVALRVPERGESIGRGNGSRGNSSGENSRRSLDAGASNEGSGVMAGEPKRTGSYGVASSPRSQQPTAGADKDRPTGHDLASGLANPDGPASVRPLYAGSDDSSDIDTGEAKRAGGEGAGRNKAAAAPAEAEIKLRSCEVHERYGQLFEDMRGTKLQVITFQLALLFNAVVPAVLLGIQAGGAMRPQSTAARAANIALFLSKLLYAGYMTVVLPYFNVFTLTAELSCAWLEAAVCACLVALQWSEKETIGNAMSLCEMLVFALQILRVLLTSIIPIIMAGWEWLAEKVAGFIQRMKKGREETAGQDTNILAADTRGQP